MNQNENNVTSQSDANPQEHWEKLSRQMTELETLVQKQEKLISAQQDELNAFKKDKVRPDNLTPSSSKEKQSNRSSRRGLLKLAGAAAAAAAVGAAGLSRNNTSPAYAFSALNIDTTNLGFATTFLNTGNQGTPSPLFEVDNRNATFPAAYLDAIQGYTVNGNGVYGNSMTGTGLNGSSGSGTGTYGYSGTGYGVAGTSKSFIGGVFDGGFVPLYLKPTANVGPPTTFNHSVGEIMVDGNGNYFVCTAPGTAATVGTFKQLSTTDLGLKLFPAGHRVYKNLAMISGTLTTPPIDATMDISFASTGVPAGARGIYCAVQAVPTSGAGMILYADGTIPVPTSSNFTAPVLGVLNLSYMLVPLSAADKFVIQCYLNGKVFVDVWGYLI